MPIETQYATKRYSKDGYSRDVPVLNSKRVWEQGSRVNGKLVLEAHVHERAVSRLMSFRPAKGLGIPLLMGTPGYSLKGDTPFYRMSERLSAEAYAKFRGKLYYGKASLGVTAASYRQSAEMIRTRYGTLNQSAASLYAQLSHELAGRRSPGKNSRNASSLFLEYLFGWSPLVEDVHAATMTVIQHAAVDTWIAGTARGAEMHRERIGDSSEWSLYDRSGQVRVKRCAMVRIDNPNLWLAERAGLINVASVAWDLVPWSFVVNMFSNVGQIVNSITDFVGLGFDKESTTTFAKVYTTHQYVIPSLGGSLGVSTGVTDEKYRWVGATKRPPLSFKLPDVNWETAAMAASLFNQKLNAIGKLVVAVDQIRKASRRRPRYTE